MSDAPVFAALSEWEVLLRLAMAVVFGGLIGLERQTHGRPAGLRTNILVCLGSAAIIVAFQKLATMVHPDTGSFIHMDPARAAAGIITGIGFLGAGTIIKGKNFVMGLTTAATVWVVSAIGITIGLGHYFISTEVALFVLLTLFVVNRVIHKTRHDRYKEVRVVGRGGTALYDHVRGKLASLDLSIKDYSIEAGEGGATAVTFNVKYKDEEIGPKVLDALSRTDGVTKASWI